MGMVRRAPAFWTAFTLSKTLKDSSVRGSVRHRRLAFDPTAAIERLRMRYRHMRDKRWGRYRGYDAWFTSPINNAKLAATSVYSDRVTAFLRLFDLCSGDYARFYASVRWIGALDEAHRAEALAAADNCY